MSDRSRLLLAEANIDNAFASSALGKLPFAKAAWTILSVAEDLHLFQLSKLEADQAAVYADGLMNSLTYPLRACHRTSVKGPFSLDHKLVSEEYQLAIDWLYAAEDYAQFCTVFPLFHAGDIILRIDGDRLIASDWNEQDLSYEAYDRIVAKQETVPERILDANLVHREVLSCMRRSGGVYSVDFSAKLVAALVAAFGEYFEERHSLPGAWSFSRFTLPEYRKVLTCLQCMTYGWFVARQIAANDGASAAAFPSAVWTPKKSALFALVARHSGVQKASVQNILNYLTFGEVGVRSPDIAIQPLVDLTNGQYAISPFVLTNVNAERNLCVLLNQVPADRKIYSQLVNEKEHDSRSRIETTLQGLGLRFRHGDVDGTDIDLAIVDHADKLCLCVEIKWFIEPAEVREIRERSEEIRKGVSQAIAIAGQVRDRNPRTLALLEIDDTYDVLAVVGSENSIGHSRVQHPDVPVVKLWHLAAKIRDDGLRKSIGWLRSREYLPKEGRDFQVTNVQIASGAWKANWYGIVPGPAGDGSVVATLEDSPVLVLEHNITAAFESFHANIAGLVARGVVDGDVLLDLDAAAPRTPRVDRITGESAQIHVHVVLFELLWAFIYSWTVIYEETVQKAQLRGAEVGETTADNEQLVSRAYELWSWAKSLREDYTRWPKHLASPRHQGSERETWYALKTNLVFQQAASFLMSHELAHITQGHLDISRVDANADALSVQLENEADQSAFDNVVGQGLEDKEKADKAWAILSVMLSSMFSLPDFRFALVSRGHPPLHHRLGHLVRSLGFESEAYRYYFPLLARVVLQDAFPELARPGQHYENAEEAFHAALDDLDRLAATL